jgi:hypothetical protein
VAAEQKKERTFGSCLLDRKRFKRHSGINTISLTRRPAYHKKNTIRNGGSRSFIPLHVIFAIEVFFNHAQTYFKNAEHGFISLIKHSDVSLG